MLKFYWNGVKDNGGKLQRCFYSDAKLINFPEGTITTYARTYESFSDGVRQAFEVKNDSDIMTDYMEKDRIRVTPTHPLYGEVVEAMKLQKAHQAKLSARRAA